MVESDGTIDITGTGSQLIIDGNTAKFNGGGIYAQGEAAITFNSSMGVTYPISENWIYRATVGFGSNFGQNDSSLFEKKRNFHIGIHSSISYVF